MLVDLYAFHRVQLPLLLVLENLLLPCDFGEHNVLFKLLLEDLVCVPIALDGFDRLELILRLDVLGLIILPLPLSPLLLQQQRGSLSFLSCRTTASLASFRACSSSLAYRSRCSCSSFSLFSLRFWSLRHWVRFSFSTLSRLLSYSSRLSSPFECFQSSILSVLSPPSLAIVARTRDSFTSCCSLWTVGVAWPFGVWN